MVMEWIFIMVNNNWKLELNEYIRQGEPDKVDKSYAWKTAIGLQDVDGLKPSEYLIETAKEHIEGKISITEADKRIYSYYEERKDRDEIEEDTKEADIVSVRIAKLLGEKTFQFSPVEWQIHPFGEGNTRSTAVFIVKYLKTFGFNISNETFAENSWYFRNALVRANYNDWQNGIHETTKFLEMFFENLLMSAGHELKNRYMHIDYENQSAIQSANVEISKFQNGTLEVSLEELAIINILIKEPTATQKRIAELTGKSERTIKRRTVEMQDKGLICRENGKRNGKWKVLV